MKILDIIFGKKNTINHPILGKLVSDRIRGNNQTKSYTWVGSKTLGNTTKETTLIMEGNPTGPNPLHINFISDLVQNWEQEYLPKIERIISEKRIDKKEVFFKWKNDFYVGGIVPLDNRKSEFELTIEPLDDNVSKSIGIEFKNHNIIKVYTY